MPIRAADPFGSFIAGRAARQDEEYADTRNALARSDLEQAPRRNRLAELQVQSAERQFSQEQIQQALQQTAATASRLAQSQSPRQEAQMYPEFVQGLLKQNPQLAQADDNEWRQYMDFVAGQAQSKLGVGPAAPAGPMSAQGKVGADVRGGYLTPEQGDAAINPGMSEYQRERLDLERQKLNKPAGGAFRPLTPQEVQEAGLPAGTSAQVGPDGKIDVLSKRDNTGVLSQKDQTTAKLKLTTVKLARQQLNNIKKKFAGVQGTFSAGPFGQGNIPTEKGRAFDAAVNQMRSTLTALTRVPGVGAMSDYETKLDQAKFPNRNDYESVTGDQIQGIDDMLALIENGYTGLLGGGTQEQQPQQAAQQQAPRRVKVDAQGNVIGN